MNKTILFSLSLALVLMGAGCSSATTSDSSGDSAVAQGVSVFEIDGLILDSMYNEHNGNTDGYKDYIFTEQEGTCTDASLGTLSYLYESGSDVQIGSADIQESDAMVSLATGSNAMTWYFFDAEVGKVSCSYTIDGETFEVNCVQSGSPVCSGTFSGVAIK